MVEGCADDGSGWEDQGSTWGWSRTAPCSPPSNGTTPTAFPHGAVKRVWVHDRWHLSSRLLRKVLMDTLAVLLNDLGAVALSQGEPVWARGYHQQALAIACEVGDRAGEGRTLNDLGRLVDSLGLLEEACSYYQFALKIAYEVGDRSTEGVTLSNLGTIAQRLRLIKKARSYYQHALNIFEEIGADDQARLMRERLRALK